MIDTCCSHARQTSLSSSASPYHATIQMSITHPALLLYSQLLPILYKAMLTRKLPGAKSSTVDSLLMDTSIRQTPL